MDRPLRWATFRGPIFFTSDLAPFFMPYKDVKVVTEKKWEWQLTPENRRTRGGDNAASLGVSRGMSPIWFTKVDRPHSFQIGLRHYLLATETSNSFRMCTHVMLMWGRGIRLQRKQFLFSDINSAATGQDRNRHRLVLLAITLTIQERKSCMFFPYWWLLTGDCVFTVITVLHYSLL